MILGLRLRQTRAPREPESALVAIPIEHLALALARAGETSRAAALAGYADAALQRAGFERSFTEETTHGHLTELLRAASSRTTSPVNSPKAPASPPKPPSPSPSPSRRRGPLLYWMPRAASALNTASSSRARRSSDATISARVNNTAAAVKKKFGRRSVGAEVRCE